MRMLIVLWDGHSLNDDNFEVQVGVGSGNGMAAAIPTYIDMGQGDPVLGGKVLTGSSYTFRVLCKGTTDAELEAQRDTLCGWFLPNDFTKRILIGYDVDDGNKAWYLEGFPISSPMLEVGAVNNYYSITLSLSVPYWIEYDLNTDEWVIPSSPDTQVMENVGNIPALPKFEITPVEPKLGDGTSIYKFFVGVHTNGWSGTIPVDLTPDGLDTADLVSDSKMRADGNDVIVRVDGVDKYRWFGGGGINDVDTHIWADVRFTTSPTMTINVALDGSTTPSTLAVKYIDDSITLPQNSTLQVGNEFIAYIAYTLDVPNKIITFTGLTRNSKGSAIAAHSINDAIYWIENDIWVLYGNLDATAPVIDANNEPTFDLSVSSNSLWVYNGFAKVMAFNTVAYPPVPYGPGRYYYDEHGASGIPIPTEIIGLRIESIQSGNGVVSDNTRAPNWTFFHPGAISNFEANGEKYRSGALFGTMTIRDGRGTTATVFYTEDAPDDPATWEAVAIDTPCGTNPRTVYAQITGGLGTTLPLPYAMIEFDDVTLTIANPPTVTIPAAEQSNYQLGGTLENSTTGEIIQLLDIVTKTGETITIDCETLEVYSSDGKRLRGFISFSGPKRDEWMTLQPGNNSIVFTDANTDEVEIVTTWRARNTI